MAVSPGSIFRSAVAFVASHRVVCLRGLWLPVALVFIATLLIGRPVACLATGLCAATRAHGALGRFELLAWLALLLFVLLPLFAAMQAVVWRLVLRPASTPSALPIRFGADERGLVVVALVRGAIAMVVGTLVFLAIGAISLLVRHVTGHLPILVLGLVLPVAVLLAVGYVGTRLRLAGPATIQGDASPWRDSWRATRRRVAWLRLADGKLMLPGLAAIALLLVVVIGIVGVTPRLLPELAAIVTLPPDQLCTALWKALGPWLVVLVVIGYGLAIAGGALVLAGRAYEYRVASASWAGRGES